MQLERKCLNHYSQGVRGISSAVELFCPHPENLWLQFWCQTEYVAFRWQNRSLLLACLPFSSNKANQFTHHINNFSLPWCDWLHAHSLITSSGATICKSTSFPCFAFLSLLEASCTSLHWQFLFAIAQPALCDLLFALQSALGSCRRSCHAQQIASGHLDRQGQCGGTGSVIFQAQLGLCCCPLSPTG